MARARRGAAVADPRRPAGGEVRRGSRSFRSSRGARQAAATNRERDAALRRAISVYYEVDQLGYAEYVRRGVVDYFFRMADEQAELIVFLDAPQATSTRGEGTGIGLRVGWDEIRRRPRFFNAVARLGTWAASMIRRHDGAYAANAELREQIEAYLAR